MHLRFACAPLNTLQVMQRNMDRWFDTALNRLGDEIPDGLNQFVPPVDIRETGDSLEFLVELPGFEKDQIEIKVERGHLVLSGERKWNREAKEENYHRVERSYGRFQRTFALPSAVEPGKITANLKNGVLHIVLPKSERAKPHQIAVTVS